MAKITEVKEINLPELELYASRSEVKLYRHDEPEPGLFAAESLKVIDRALAAGYRPVSFLFEKNVFREKAAYLAERFPDTEIYLADEETMTGITGYRLTGGALSLMRRKSLPSFTDICTGKKRLAVLEDVENPANVGAIIRSAAALGIGGVLLTTDCTDPLYRLFQDGGIPVRFPVRHYDQPRLKIIDPFILVFRFSFFQKIQAELQPLPEISIIACFQVFRQDLSLDRRKVTNSACPIVERHKGYLGRIGSVLIPADCFKK